MNLDTRYLLCALLALAPACTPDESDDPAPDARIAVDGATGDVDLPEGDGTTDPPDGAAADMDPAADRGPEPEPEPELDQSVEPEPEPEPEPDMAVEPEPDMAVEPEPDMMIEDRDFSFFVTSLEAMRNLSGSQDGFGGDFGGLDGADAICQTIAISVGMGHKQWRAFLSVTAGPDGQPVNAIDRIGAGPWYDANGRLIAQNIQGLLQSRPAGDAQTINDLPDEHGVPLSVLGDSHDILTGSNRQGRLNRPERASTCNDWTSASGQVGRNIVMMGHAWPRSNRMGREWIADHTAHGCAPGVNLVQDGPGSGDCVGCGGGYGGFYCFALSP